MPRRSLTPHIFVAMALSCGLGGAALAEHPCAAPRGQLCWEVNNPSITPQSMKLSLLSAMVMGAQGIDGWMPPSVTWPSDFTAACQTRSEDARKRGVTNLKWFDNLDTTVSAEYKECNPAGATALMTAATMHDWVWEAIDRSHSDIADNITVQVIKQLGAPVILPYFGQWDHWLTVVQVTASMVTSTSYEVKGAILYDGLLGADLNANDKLLGPGMAPRVPTSGMSFARSYTHIMEAPKAPCNEELLPENKCGKKPGDPWYDRYICVYDPPTGAPPLASLVSGMKTTFAVMPGILHPGESMTAAIAQSRAPASVRLAGKDVDPAVSTALREGQQDPATYVEGFWPSGEPWNYYLVPMRDPKGKLSAIIQLSGLDGAFEAMAVLPKSIDFAPISLERARVVASQGLNGSETLDNGRLTWSPRPYVAGARSPFVPYYEFHVNSGRSAPSHDVVRVIRHTGKLVAREPAGLH